jgi:hypothetical protein
MSTAVWVWWGPILGILGLEIKIMLFGKLKNKYVMEEISKKNTAVKWFLLGFVLIGSTILLIIFTGITYERGGIQLYASLSILLMGAVSLLDLWLFNYLFPKSKNN